MSARPEKKLRVEHTKRASVPATVEPGGAPASTSATDLPRKRLRPEDIRVTYTQVPIEEKEYLRI
jgi:hypothetical protein